jgi:hypothetical protein
MHYIYLFTKIIFIYLRVHTCSLVAPLRLALVGLPLRQLAESPPEDLCVPPHLTLRDDVIASWTQIEQGNKQGKKEEKE